MDSPKLIVTEEQKLEANTFYKEALEILNESGAQYMLGGAFAIFHYTGIYRDTKDLDVFCKASAYPKLLKTFAQKGYKTGLTDSRWLAKVFKGEYFIDIIFDSPNNIARVDDSWLQHATKSNFTGTDILIVPPEELVWCKIYVQNRERFDGADVNHIILKYGRKMDWQRVFAHFDQHWHILLAALLMFQFVYPSEHRDIIPLWLFDELLDRAHEQYELPPAQEKVCLGPLIDQTQYGVDIREWNYKVITMRTV
jgi:hypothetical protein